MPIVQQQIKGLADSKWNGIPGSVYKCIGLDIHSTPGLTKVQQKLTKSSGSTVDALAKECVAVSTGESFWFSSTTGKIWRLASDNSTWLLVYTTAPVAGAAGCLGAMEYNGFLYWATQSRLHRISMSTAHATAADWTTNAVPDWKTFSITNATYHPMAQQNLKLFIGDGYYVASVDSSGTFTANALDIKTPLTITCMIDLELDILIGTKVASNVNKAEVLRWDAVATSWLTSDPIEEIGVNAFIRDDNYVYAQCGTKGNIYFYDGEQLKLFKKIPGDYTNTATAIVYPGSVHYFNQAPVFGFSQVSGNPAEYGVYSFGAYSQDYTKVLDLSWVISQDKVSDIEIGAVRVIGNDLMVAWKDGSTFGVDKIDYTAKYASAYFETLMLFQERRDQKDTLALVEAFYNSLPAGTSFTFSYSVNGASYVAMTSVTDSTMNRVFAQLAVENIGSLQIKVAFGVSTNSSPTMEALGVSLIE